MNHTITVEDKEIFLDIFEDLAEDLAEKHKLDVRGYSRQAAMERVPFHFCFLDIAKKYGKDHPKFPLIAKYFQEPEVAAVDCSRRQDWWTAIVRMLDDTKLHLIEADRKDLYQDLQSLIGHRLERKEY